MSQQPGAGLCSRRSVARGPGQRVVSFSFWGELGTKVELLTILREVA